MQQIAGEAGLPVPIPISSATIPQLELLAQGKESLTARKLSSSPSTTTLSSLCSSATTTSSTSLSSSSTSASSAMCSSVASSGASSRSALGTSPGVHGVTVGADRRRTARERLRSAMAAVSSDRRAAVGAPASAPRSTAPLAPARSFRAPDPIPTAAAVPHSSEDDEDAIAKSTQLGRLSMIAAASGWDIKLRELVMKEAKQAEPSSSNTTPLVSPRPSLDRPRSSSVVRPVSRSDEADVVEAPQITPVSSPRRRATLVSRFSASAPTLNRRGSKIPQPTPSTNIPETDGTPATPGGNGLLDRRPPAGPAAQVARGERLQRRASDYSTIIGAYDERLREIVLEAAGGLETRLRNRNTVATDNGAESTGDVSSSESSSSARDSFRRSLPPAADMRRRRTMSFSNMNPMARSDAEERDHFTPTPRTRTAPTTPSRKSTILRRQTFQHSQTTADRPLQSAALEAKTDSGSADPLPSMIKVDPLPDSRQTRRWATLLEPNKGDLSTGVPVPSTARNITIVPSTGYITTLLSTPASPTSAPSNSHRLPIPPKQPDQAAGDRLSPPSPATPPRPQETTPAVASTLPSQSFSVFKDPGHHDRDSAVSLSAESNGGPSPSPDPHPPSPPFPPQKAEIGMYIRYL